MRRLKLILVMSFLLIAGVAGSQEVKKVKITDVEKLIANSPTPLIVNFWATWCKPCVEEIPYFISEVNARPGDSIQLVLVSLDFKETFPAEIAAFARKHNFKTTIWWLDETNADYFCPKVDARWSGAIPATLFINNKKGYRNFFEEQLSHEELKKEIMAILQMP